MISTEDLIEGDGGAFEAVSLGLGDTDDFRLNFGSGDPNKDPGSANAQTLRYVIEQLPDPEFGTLQLNSVDVALNQELTLEQIKQLSLQVLQTSPRENYLSELIRSRLLFAIAASFPQEVSAAMF